MIHVRDGNFVPELFQYNCHAKGIRAAGYSGQNAVVRNEHMVFVDGLADLRWKAQHYGNNSSAR